MQVKATSTTASRPLSGLARSVLRSFAPGRMLRLAILIVLAGLVLEGSRTVSQVCNEVEDFPCGP